MSISGRKARRLGVAIRYVAPSMKQVSGDRLLPEDWDRARRNADMKREIPYKGVKPEQVKENRRA